MGAALLGALTPPGSAFAQGCAMCYNTAAAARAGAIHALRTGILVLLIPPVLIFGSVCLFAWRRRDHFNDDNTAEDNPSSLSIRLPGLLEEGEFMLTEMYQNRFPATKQKG